MTVSKRTRFEILRRDEYACRYCGSRAPDVALVVDHVVPVALGGTDRPDNLVAACKPCNQGKTSVAPGDSLVEDVREGALRHAELVRQAYALLVERMGDRDEYVEEFVAAYGEHDPAPNTWRATIWRWFEMGVPIEILVEAVEIAQMSPVKPNGRFRYFCGVVWNKVHLVDEEATARRYLDGRFMTSYDQQDLWCLGYDSGKRRERADQERRLNGEPVGGWES